MTQALPSVFDYLDFRAFLGDHYLAKKAEGRGFSYRAFSRRAGLKSPNHLKLVIEGERSLTPATTPKYADALRLESDERAYFFDLVAFNQARTNADRIEAYQALTGHQGYRQAQTLDTRHAAYFAEWYIPAIRELAMLPEFRGEPAWIAATMMPRISEEQAARGLEVLIELGLLRRDEEGDVLPTEWHLQVPDETQGVHLAQYHRAMLQRAALSIELIPSSDRHLSAITLGVGEGGFARIVDRMERLRRELLSLATLEEEPERVVHVGLQVFPLSERVESKS